MNVSPAWGRINGHIRGPCQLRSQLAVVFAFVREGEVVLMMARLNRLPRSRPS